MTDELPEHFPSLTAALSQCIRYERKSKAGSAAKRGTRVHHYIYETIVNNLALESVPKSYRAQCAYAHKVLGSISGERALWPDNRLIAEEVIYASIERWKIPCTPDYVAKLQKGVACINWKTGSEREYTLPQRFYTVACCQAFAVSSVQIIECYVDLQHEKRYTLSLENSIKLCADMVSRFLSRGFYEPTVCEYCRWCQIGPTGDGSCEAGGKLICAH